MQASRICVATATVDVVVVVVMLVVVWTKVVSTSTTVVVVTLVAVSVEAVVVDAAVDVAVPVTVVVGAATPRREQMDETLAGARRWRRGVDSLGQAVGRAPRRSTAMLVMVTSKAEVVDVDTTVVEVSVATSVMVVTVMVVDVVVSVAVVVAVSVTVTDWTCVVVTSVVWPTVTGDRKPLQKALASAARSSTQAGGSVLLAHRPRRRPTAPVWHVASHVGAVTVADVSPARATAAARRAPRSILRTRERPGG